MATETPATIYTGAADFYLGLVDASLTANERMAKVARVWIDESLGFQQDLAQTVRKAFEESRTAYAGQGETPATPVAFVSRAGDIARATYFLWTETGLKAQERFGRVAQTAFGEMQSAQADLTNRTEARISEFARRANGAASK
ncbi:MAG: hypothetical protein HYX51_02080 [Chloroflexi bacterium]|nr:hypothetical protein [Chloroflexota bacterium]